MKKILSIIILSNAIDNEIYQMNCQCVSSLYDSENWNEIGGLEVILIESNKDNKYSYDDRVLVITPKEEFNFNKFLNLGVKNSSGRYLALCNNDIVFSKNWFSEILKVKILRPDILCFSPIDRDYKTMSYDLFPEKNDYYIGWDNKYHFAAWCFVLNRAIFSVIGKFDETFNFYSADDDFLMTLRKYSIDNALVTKSNVKHLSQQVTKKVNEKSSPRILDKEKYPLKAKYLKRGLSWLWDDVHFYEAFFKMEKKWGINRMIGRINRLINKYSLLRKRFITKILYSKPANKILSILTGIN